MRKQMSLLAVLIVLGCFSSPSKGAFLIADTAENPMIAVSAPPDSLPVIASPEGSAWIDAIENKFSPSDQTFFLVPSTRTVPSGRTSLSNIDGALFNLSVGLGSSTELTLYTTPPLIRNSESYFMYGIKQLLWRGTSTSGSAFAYSDAVSNDLATGAIFSYGGRSNITIGAVYFTDGRGSGDVTACLGLKINPGEHIAFIVDAILPAASAGFRWYGEHIAFDLGGYYNFAHGRYKNDRSLSFVPFIKLLYLF